MSALDCRPGRAHRFDSPSGYCRWGCGVRDDGRVVSRAGDVIYPGPLERPQQQPALEGMSEYVERIADL
ncbi:hypothetical protein QE381_000409 [Microbacterium sp. SORGH_AS 888]|nr:hypothetical protein [Microbacterium sp. SORGH_AS_0888]